MILHALGGTSSADVVVLLHGFGADRFAWVGTAPALADRATVLALELPGHGQAADERVTGFDDAVERAAAALASHDGWRRATRHHVVGHSLGGAFGIALAARDPERLASLTAIAPLGLGDGIDIDWLHGLLALDDEADAMAHLQRLVVNPRLIARQLAPLLLTHLRRPGVRDALSAWVRSVPDVVQSVRRDVDTLAALPRTLIWGEDDRIVPSSPESARRFGGASLSLPACGHLPQIEARVAVNEAIVGRLNDA